MAVMPPAEDLLLNIQYGTNAQQGESSGGGPSGARSGDQDLVLVCPSAQKIRPLVDGLWENLKEDKDKSAALAFAVVAFSHPAIFSFQSKARDYLMLLVGSDVDLNRNVDHAQCVEQCLTKDFSLCMARHSEAGVGSEGDAACLRDGWSLWERAIIRGNLDFVKIVLNVAESQNLSPDGFFLNLLEKVHSELGKKKQGCGDALLFAARHRSFAVVEFFISQSFTEKQTLGLALRKVDETSGDNLFHFCSMQGDRGHACLKSIFPSLPKTALLFLLFTPNKSNITCDEVVSKIIPLKDRFKEETEGDLGKLIEQEVLQEFEEKIELYSQHYENRLKECAEAIKKLMSELDAIQGERDQITQGINEVFKKHPRLEEMAQEVEHKKQKIEQLSRGRF